MNKKDNNIIYMEKALKQAKLAFKNDEVPIGAVIVKEGKIIARAYNRRNKDKAATAHAEILAIKRACKKVGDWRLSGCQLYVTVLPCPMCAGAIVNARLGEVYFGARNNNSFIFEEIMTNSDLNHKTLYYGGLLEEECSRLLQAFFLQKRAAVGMITNI